MKPHFAHHPRKRGVALVTTVIVVAVLAVVAVAFMQSTTTDRLSARSVANYTRARLAADAGLAVAEATLARAMTNDTFIVVANTNRQLFVGNGTNSTNFSYTPAFSTSPNLASAVAPIVTGGIPTTNVAGGILFTNQMSGGLSITSPAVSWVFLTNAAGQTNACFAYWVEDLGGKLDLALVGATSAGDITNARRLTGTNPAEIALWSFFNPSSASDAGNANATALTAARSNLLTTATARLVNSSVTTNMLADFAVNLRHDTNEPEVIPFGFGYADAGKAKYNLNTNTNAAGAARLADAIRRNLPNFGNRSGAMDPTAYVNSIAASIVDYADTNDIPIADDPNNPTYFGIENIPWPNELFDRIRFTKYLPGSARIQIQLKDFVEVWNMGNKEIAAGSSIYISNNYDLVLTFTNPLIPNTSGPGVGFEQKLKDLQNRDMGNTTNWAMYRAFTVTAPIPPNGYAVLDADPDLNDGFRHRSLTAVVTNADWVAYAKEKTNAVAAAAWQVTVTTNNDKPNLSFKARFGGQVVQQSKGGRWPNYLNPANDPPVMEGGGEFIFGNPVGFASQTKGWSSGGVPLHSGGDPRAQYFLSDPLRSQAYFNTRGYASPGGRNWERANLATYPESEVQPGKYWPDGGHATSTDRGQNPTSYTDSPMSFSNTPATNNWVMFRNDTGSYSNILELGNIYDPMQWSDQSGSTVARQPGLWVNLTAAATPDARFGGRNTLRVGRWEFSKFNTNGQRASQLLDLFAASTNAPGPGGVVQAKVVGKINLNTAGTNALRALVAGVYQSADPGLTPNGTNTMLSTKAVRDFINAVTNFRSQQPFFSTAQLATLTTNITSATWPASSVFGNASLLSVTEWNDRAAENWFAKVYPLSTVRSRNFMVHVVGQALQTNGTTVLSTARKSYQICMEPVRATSGSSAGFTTNNIPRLLSVWDL